MRTQPARGVLSTRQPAPPPPPHPFHGMHSTGRKHGEVAVTCTNSADDLAPRIAQLATGGSGSTAGCFPGVCVCGGGGGGGDNGPASMRPSQSDVEQRLRGVGADRV